ncbi:Uncharacterised protein [Legionella beliardensis]|uniref:Uncharacterized protein n=1 Tax=Legionella beliardensis TaxID=91822 RepID=A0A378HZE9_9GAMM|nr:hypothetical protein [Legionella beliardensis]STX28297.1 Uncharacterised protein [Legionella beliardensis]
MPLHEVDQTVYHQDMVTAFFKAGCERNYIIFDALLKMKGISLNIVNESGKSFIAAWCQSRNPNQANFKKMEEWVTSGQVDLTFKCQGADIVDWCIENIANCYDLKLQEHYLALAEKIIQFLPFNKELTQKYSTLLPNSVKTPCTIRITKALLSLPGINIQQLGPNNKDAFQTALEAQNTLAINLLAETLALFKDRQVQSTANNISTSSTLDTLKLLISDSYRLLLNNNNTEIEESLVKLTIQMLHLFQESGDYPNNFAELLFELANNLSSLSIQNNQLANIAYDLRKAAADSGHEQAQRILTSFSDIKVASTEKLSPQAEIQDKVKPATSSSPAPALEKVSHTTFFQRLKSRKNNAEHSSKSVISQKYQYTQ